MKKVLLTLCTCCLCCLTVLVLTITTADAGPSKVCVCHRPPGNPNNAHTICVGAAAAKAHLKHGDTEGECPVPCDENDDCGSDQFCKRSGDVCADDSPGVCTDVLSPCPTTIIPVCGCDGITYNNACEANAAGVNVASEGACAGGGGGECGGAAGDTCADDEFCKLETGACSPDAEGVCTLIPGVCHPDFTPVCGCDGETYSNECFAASNGVSVAATGACVEGIACNVGDGTCADGEFCRPDVGDCAAAAPGNCTVLPGVCPLNFFPVCGCDGVTYSNPCSAFSAGVGIFAQGECEADQQVCSGSVACPSGEVCIRPVGECAAETEGVCQSIPVVCTANVDPVCGCDGITYSNACVANSAGVTVASEGECGEPVACDGVTGVTCPAGQFCKHADGACEADVQGVCTDLPLTCDPVDSPVCSCIGVGFPNACYANAVGLNIQNTGACVPPPQPVACDGATGVTCPADEFCKHPDGACGVEVQGVCSAKPLTCEPIDAPVCACGGIGFPNVCYANAVGFNLQNIGVCIP